STYEYAILPNLTQQQTALYAKQPPFVTLENSGDVQSIRHDALHSCGIVFYSASSLDVGNFSVTVDKPCILFIDFGDPLIRVTAADPTQSQSEVEVVLSYQSGDVESLYFHFPKDADAGKSVTLQTTVGWKL